MLALLSMELISAWRSRRVIGALLTLVIVLVSLVLIYAPLWIATGVVAAGVVAWCTRVERHPEPPHRSR